MVVMQPNTVTMSLDEAIGTSPLHCQEGAEAGEMCVDNARSSLLLSLRTVSSRYLRREKVLSILRACSGPYGHELTVLLACVKTGNMMKILVRSPIHFSEDNPRSVFQLMFLSTALCGACLA